MKLGRRALLAVALVALLACLAGQSAAPLAARQEGAGLTLAVEAGFDGFYKGPFWLPVQVTAANSGPAVEGAIRIVTGGTSPGSSNRVVYTSPISLPTLSNKRVTLYVHLPSLVTGLDVELLDDRGRVVAAARSNRLERLDGDDLLYGIVGPEPEGLSYLENVTAGRSNGRVAFMDVAALPEAAAAWNSLDVIAFQGVDTAGLSAAQLAALRGWLDGGGVLVVAGGPDWQPATAGLADLLPVTVSGSQSVADLPAMSTRAGAPFRDPGPYLVATSSLRTGELLLHQNGLPLLARRVWGRGAVFFLALDPRLAPLRDWDGSEVLWGLIAAAAPRLPPWGQGAQNGFSAGAAVRALPSLALPSTLQLIFFLAAYVAIVGPANYLLLRRVNRRELAWLTIPAIVLAFSAIAYVAGFQLKGNEIIVNQMSIAYGRTDGEQMRVQTIVGLYSPRRATYDLVFPGDALVRPFNPTFGSLGGGGNTGPVVRDSDVVVEEVRVDVGDVQTFVADSFRPLPDVSGQTVLRLDGNRLELEIEVQNNSDLTLENTGLLIGRTLLRLGALPPGSDMTRSYTLSGLGAEAAVAAASGLTPGFTTGTSGEFPATSHLAILLGTASFYNDREAQPRWQLLQALSPRVGSSATWLPNGTVTLIGWSSQEQLSLGLSGRTANHQATTLYFIELPFTRVVASGEGVTVPRPLMEWRVMAASGVYNPSANGFVMPPGWVELEFQPRPEFQTMRVTELAVVMTGEALESGSNYSPRVQLWDWREAVWVETTADWGSNIIPDALPFLDANNRVRIRVQNDSGLSVQIRELQPRLTGDLE